MKNLHVPLSEDVYALLRAEAERTQIPATALAGEAISAWLKEQAWKAEEEAIVAYVAEMAGTEFDLDPALESATRHGCP
jgi:predicted transcriptional regulator